MDRDKKARHQQEETPDNSSSEASNILHQPCLRIGHLVCIDGERAILRGSRHQAHEQFQEVARDNQCTGMAAAALAMAFVIPLGEWTRDTVDAALAIGNDFYMRQARGAVGHQLNADETEGYLFIEEKTVKLTPLHDLAIYGLLDTAISKIRRSRANLIARSIAANEKQTGKRSSVIEWDPSADDGLCSLEKGLEQFFTQSTSDLALLTMCHISVALIKRDNCLFVFDSHARGPKGYAASDHGKACVVAFAKEHKFKYISHMMHRNAYRCAHRERPHEQLYLLQFTITPMRVELVSDIEQHFRQNAEQEFQSRHHHHHHHHHDLDNEEQQQ